MKEIGKIILIILLVGLVIPGILTLVKANPKTEQAPATYSIQITQNNCLVKVLDTENIPVDKLIQGEEYTITVIFGECEGPAVKYITVNGETYWPDDLPYTFTATEDIIIYAGSAIIAPSPPTDVGAAYAEIDILSQFVNIHFYDSENNSVDIDKLIVGQSYILQIIPYEGYVINGWWLEYVDTETYEESPTSFIATTQMFLTVNVGIASGESA